ncbi:MAG: hypothetical protein Q4B70_15875 [Lachnospiraceae bacterium]|nr:hypothetical protein [Lachnospiraceae bacterium]
MKNTAKESVVDTKERKTLLYSLIGVGIMLFFRYLPLNLPEITDIGMQIIGIFLGTLFWPVLYEMFEEIGYEKGEAMPRIMLTLVIISAIIGFPMAPFTQNGLVMITNFVNLSKDMAGGPYQVSSGAYLVVSLFLGILMMVVNVLISKYILRPDTSKLKEFDIEKLNKKPLPPMSKR